MDMLIKIFDQKSDNFLFSDLNGFHTEALVQLM